MHTTLRMSKPKVESVTLTLSVEEALAILGVLGRVISGPTMGEKLNLYNTLFDALKPTGLSNIQLYAQSNGIKFS